MAAHAHQDGTFEKVSFTGEQMQGRSYERCTFIRCDRARADLSKSRFLECEFVACDLTMVRLNGASMQQVVFRDSKLLGVDLSCCSETLFSVGFEGCVLNHTFLTGLNLRKARFERCSMKGVDLERADLREAVLAECDLLDAVFSATRLQAADLTSAYNYRIDPERNSVKGARFTWPGVLGLLSKHAIVVE